MKEKRRIFLSIGVLMDDTLIRLCLPAYGKVAEAHEVGSKRLWWTTRFIEMCKSYGVMQRKILENKRGHPWRLQGDRWQLERTQRTAVGRGRSEGRGWCRWLQQREEPVHVCTQTIAHVCVCVCVSHRASLCINHPPECVRAHACQSPASVWVNPSVRDSLCAGAYAPASVCVCVCMCAINYWWQLVERYDPSAVVTAAVRRTLLSSSNTPVH